MPPEQEECPRGGVHGWEYDIEDGQALLQCWKCGKEVPTDDNE